MKRHVLMYGLIGGILIALLQWTEYQFLVVEYSIEIYGGLIAATFAVLGIWLGLKLTAKHQTIVVREVPVPAQGPFISDERKREDLHITRRELEILELIAQGLSNREIAEKLFVSEHGEDPFQPCFRQTRGETKNASGATRQGIRPSPLIYSLTSTVRAKNHSPKRMIFLSAAKISQKDDDTDPASCGMLSCSIRAKMKFVKT